MTIRKLIARTYRRLTGLRPGTTPISLVQTPTPVPPLPLGSAPSRLAPEDLQYLVQAANRYFYLGPELALARLTSGHLLYVDPLDEYVSTNIIVHGYWEPWVQKAVLTLLRPGSRIVEVGANVGYYTVTMAGAVGPQGSVISLEANPRIAALIKRSLDLNGYSARSRVIPKAALDKPGTIDFVVSRNNSGGGYVSLWESQPYADGEFLKVEAVRLDDLDVGRVDMLRMDAEGSEALILRGAEDILKANPDIVICMEWAAVQIASRTSVDDFVAWMDGLGFKFWRIGFDSGLTPVPIKDLATLEHCDLVACRRQPRPA